MSIRSRSAAGLYAVLMIIAGGAAWAAAPDPLQLLAGPPAAKPQAQALTQTIFKQSANTSAKDPRTVPALSKLLADGFKVRALRHDSQANLDIWFYLNPDNSLVVFYTSADGNSLFGGDLWEVDDKKEFSYATGIHNAEAAAVLTGEGVAVKTQQTQGAATPAGDNQGPPTAQAVAALAQAPAGAAPAGPPSGGGEKLTGSTMLHAFEGAQWIEVGSQGAPLLYLVADPECPFCHAFWQGILPYVNTGKVRVRIILSAALAAENGNRSLTAATAILAYSDSAAAWRSYIEDNRLLQDKEAGADQAVATAQSATKIAAGIKRLAANEKMRQTLLVPNQLTGVPIVLWRSKDGKIRYNYGFDAAQVPGLVEAMGSLTVASGG